MQSINEPHALVRRFSEEVRDGLNENSTELEKSLSEDLRVKELQREIDGIERSLAAKKYVMHLQWKSCHH
jgi:hypothetical protein